MKTTNKIVRFPRPDTPPRSEKFSELIRDAWIKAPYDESKFRPVDYSFLFDAPRTLEQIEIRKYKPDLKKVCNAIAAVLIFCVIVAGTVVWPNPDTAFAERIKRVFYILTNGMFTTNPEDEYLDDSANIFKIETMDDIGKSKKFLPELLVPQYIQDGYKFESLEITKYILNGNCVAEYRYKVGSDTLHITMRTLMGEEAIADSLAGGEIIQENDLTISTWKDADTHGINAAKGDTLITVTGDIPTAEMLKIVKNLQ